jgi:hypothetical protein
MSLTVRFTGICTHLRNLGLGENAPSSHRVVLVRADQGAFIQNDAFPDGAKIPPHIPKLKIDPADIVSIDGYPYGLEPTGQAGVWRLCGVHLTLEGTTEEFWRDTTCTDIPRLETAATAPGISSEVVAQGQAACYFDIHNGKLSSYKTAHDARFALLETASDAPGLRVKSFWNQESCLIRLRPGATIEIEHTGYQQGDSHQDFLLHYRVFSDVPSDAIIPPEPKSERNKIPGDISIGCSNSQYP